MMLKGAVCSVMLLATLSQAFPTLMDGSVNFLS